MGGGTYKDLEYYSNKIDFDNMQDWTGEGITKEKIRKRFDMIKEFTEFYIDFQDAPLKNLS